MIYYFNIVINQFNKISIIHIAFYFSYKIKYSFFLETKFMTHD